MNKPLSKTKTLSKTKILSKSKSNSKTVSKIKSNSKTVSKTKSKSKSNSKSKTVSKTKSKSKSKSKEKESPRTILIKRILLSFIFLILSVYLGYKKINDINSRITEIQEQLTPEERGSIIPILRILARRLFSFQSGLRTAFTIYDIYMLYNTVLAAIKTLKRGDNKILAQSNKGLVTEIVIDKILDLLFRTKKTTVPTTQTSPVLLFDAATQTPRLVQSINTQTYPEMVNANTQTSPTQTSPTQTFTDFRLWPAN